MFLYIMVVSICFKIGMFYLGCLIMLLTKNMHSRYQSNVLTYTFSCLMLKEDIKKKMGRNDIIFKGWGRVINNIRLEFPNVSVL